MFSLENRCETLSDELHRRIWSLSCEGWWRVHITGRMRLLDSQMRVIRQSDSDIWKISEYEDIEDETDW